MPLHRILGFAVALFALCGAVAWAADAPVAGGCGSQAKLPPERRVSNTAHWATASEEENFGYDVYRGDAEQGPFVKLTKQPMLGNGTTAQTHDYKYVDDSIDPCKDYWYYVESISNDGAREKFTPVFHAPAKRHAAGKPGAEPVKPAAH